MDDKDNNNKSKKEESKTIKESPKTAKKEENNASDANETEVLMKQLEFLSFTEDKSFEDPISFQRSININNTNTKLDINLQNQNSKDFSGVDNNYIPNFEYNDKREILNLKLNNILTTLRLSDIKLNIKYYGALFKFGDYFKDNILVTNYFTHINDLFNLIIELLFIIKKENEKNEMSNNKKSKNGIIMKLEKEIHNKDKQIEALLNKLKVEQRKVQRTSKDNTNELILLQKENKELYYQLSIYKTHIKKVDANNKILEQKLNSIIIDNLNKKIKDKISSDTNNINNINNNININNFNNIFPPTINLEENDIGLNEADKNNFGSKKNAKEFLMNQHIRKLNINLINLLKEINEKLDVYNSTLNKIEDDESQTSILKNLNNKNILADFDKIDNLFKSFLASRDKILNKIYKFILLSPQPQNKKSKDNLNNSTQKVESPSSNNKKENKEDNEVSNDKKDTKITVNIKNILNKKK